LGSIVSNPIPNAVVDPTFLTFGTDDGGLYVLQNLATTPTLAAGFPVFTGAEVRSAPSIDAGTSPNRIFFCSFDGRVYRYDVNP
jgi:hypothetical protein